ncbi:MAG: ComEA family DNA-binding protein [Synergistales bacterium]|nr:ComEA family DNA-binding protein [Synergistales bacterium]
MSRVRGILFIVAGVACFLAAWGMLGYFSGAWQEDEAERSLAGPALHYQEEETGAGGVPEPSREPSEWVVYVTGGVENPGVYHLESGSRIYQLVARAGGFAAEADAEAINMAAELADGVHVHVPREGEAAPPEPGGAGTETVTGGTLQGQEDGGGLVPVNTAGQKALETLPGIGPVTAAALIEEREQNGPFAAPEDLLRVRGIGPKKMESIAPLVSFGR